MLRRHAVTIGAVVAVAADRAGASGLPARSPATGRSSTTTSPSTSSTGRSAASRADRCSVRSAARCRPTGSSRRCPRSAAIDCPAATPRWASSSSRGRTCRSASRGAGASASSRSGSTAPSVIPARCATRPAASPRIVLGMPAQQLDLQALVEFVLECSLDSRTTAESVAGRFAKRADASRCSSGSCSGSD